MNNHSEPIPLLMPLSIILIVNIKYIPELLNVIEIEGIVFEFAINLELIFLYALNLPTC